MSATLRDPNLPPGAIVETYEEGGALRNDGTRLTPAAQNPWYLLATVAGEQEGNRPPDMHLHARNRRFWNGWMCQGMEETARAALAEDLDLPVEELAPLDADEMLKVHARLRQAFPHVTPENAIPQRCPEINLSEVCFLNPSVFEKFYFAKSADFTSTHFAQLSMFIAAHFASNAEFANTHFNLTADFRNVQFDGKANFITAYFAVLAIFANAHFVGAAFFVRTEFAGYAFFANAHFTQSADFSDGTFKAATIFIGARFETRVPEFYQREMHQNTTFSDDRSLWPAVTDENADDSKQAYTRLRQIAAGNHNPDLEHFFLRQEMRCKQHLARRFDKWFFGAYALFSDYGISVVRPVAGLALVLAIGTLAIGWHLWVLEQEGDAIIALRQALGISLGNILPFLGIVPRIFPEFHASAPWWLNAMAVFQSLAGIVLLFFLGLGLRNRFRLR